MVVVSVDMDDTLIRTSTDYSAAIEELSAYMHHQHGVCKQRVVELQDWIDHQLIYESSIRNARFVASFERTLLALVEEPLQSEVRRVRRIARNVYKTEAEYAVRGFMPGAREMLDYLSEVGDSLHLVTAGSPHTQNTKIRALSLQTWFDDIHITPLSVGKQAVFEDIVADTLPEAAEFVHVGNSAVSDVEPTLAVGGTPICIADASDWLSEDVDYEVYTKRSDVYHYDDAPAFLNSVPQILSTG